MDNFPGRYSCAQRLQITTDLIALVDEPVGIAAGKEAQDGGNEDDQVKRHKFFRPKVLLQVHGFGLAAEFDHRVDQKDSRDRLVHSAQIDVVHLLL